MVKPLAGGGMVRFWTIAAPYFPQELQPSNGHAESFADAEAALREKFDKRLDV